MTETYGAITAFDLCRRIEQYTGKLRVFGTATQTAASAIVTATTSIFDAGMVGLPLVVYDTGTTILRTVNIIGYTSGTVVTVDETTGFAAKTIVVDYSLSYLKRGLDYFLSGMRPGSDLIHTWSFLRPLAQITIGSSLTGTGYSSSGAVITPSGSETKTVLTAVTGTFNPSLVGTTIYLYAADGTTVSQTVQILSYISSTSLGLDSTTEWASVGTPLNWATAYNGMASLPSDFSGQEDVVIYTWTGGILRTPMKRVSVNQIVDYWRWPNTLNYPVVFALFPVPSATAGLTWQIGVAPIPSQPWTFNYRYRVLVPDITDSTACYLPGGRDHQATIEWAAKMLWDADKHATGSATAEYGRQMLRSIALDKALTDDQRTPATGRYGAD